jgi:hypothetical protein
VSEALLALPTDLRSKSISAREVVLPLPYALAAIDLLESEGFHILGWEGWVKAADGRVGHGSAGRYASASLAGLAPSEAAAFTRSGIVEDAACWEAENAGTTDALHFCITAMSNPTFQRTAAPPLN